MLSAARVMKITVMTRENVRVLGACTSAFAASLLDADIFYFWKAGKVTLAALSLSLGSSALWISHTDLPHIFTSGVVELLDSVQLRQTFGQSQLTFNAGFPLRRAWAILAYLHGFVGDTVSNSCE